MTKDNKRIMNQVDREIDVEQTKSAILFSVLSVLIIIAFFATYIAFGY